MIITESVRVLVSHNLSETNAIAWVSMYCRWKLSVTRRYLNSLYAPWEPSDLFCKKPFLCAPGGGGGAFCPAGRHGGAAHTDVFIVTTPQPPEQEGMRQKNKKPKFNFVKL